LIFLLNVVQAARAERQKRDAEQEKKEAESKARR
jgi:hypothetical protein